MIQFLSSIASRHLQRVTAIAGATLGASVLQAGSAQAISFYDFNTQWEDGTTTQGWIKLDDTPDDQGSVAGEYKYQNWNLNNLLDANFTHDGTSYGKPNITDLGLYRYVSVEDSSFQAKSGSLFNALSLSFGDWTLYIDDYGADGSPADQKDSGYKYNSDAYGFAKSGSVVERSAKAVPEPTALAGLALVGAGIATARRKQGRKTSA